MIVRSAWTMTRFNTSGLIDYMRALTGARLHDAASERLTLCAVELFNNVCLHGRGERDEEHITLTVGIDPDRAWLCLEDQGPAFNPILEAKLRMPEIPATLDDLEESGRGLTIIHQISDHVAYVRDQETNRLTVTVLNDAD